MDRATSDVSRAFQFRVDDLREKLFGSRLPVYAFVDPLLDDPGAQLFAREPEKPLIHRIPLEQWGLQTEDCPYFFQVTNTADDALEITLALAEAQLSDAEGAHSLCGWFVSDKRPKDIKQQLRMLMDYRLPDRNRWFFRFFDPRVQRHWKRIMGEAFPLPGLAEWWFLDRHGQISKQQGDPQAAGQSPSDTQRLAFDRVGLVNEAFEQWRGIDPGLTDTAYSRLDDAIRTALGLGFSLSQVPDVIAFALHRCIVHPRIENHPRVAKWLRAAISDARSYADAAIEGDAALWKEIESGHWEHTKEKQHG